MLRTMSALAAVALLAACDTTTSTVQTIVWTGLMEPAEGWEHLQGEAVMVWAEGSEEIDAGATIAGDAPGAVRPWHVHHDTCAAGGGIVGEDGDYPRLTVAADGTATVVTTVPVTVDPAANFHVNVHLSAAEMDTIIMCADLVLQ